MVQLVFREHLQRLEPNHRLVAPPRSSKSSGGNLPPGRNPHRTVSRSPKFILFSSHTDVGTTSGGFTIMCTIGPAQFGGRKKPVLGLDKAIYSTPGQQYPIGNRLVGHKAPVGAGLCIFSHVAHSPWNSNVVMIEIVSDHLVRWSHILSTLSSHRSSRRCVLMPIDMPGQQFQESPCHDLTLTSHNVSSALTTENRYKQPDSNDLKDWSRVRGWSTRVQ